MATPYYKQYQARHKPKVRAKVNVANGRGLSRGVGVNICDGCHFLKTCRARINDMFYELPCFVVSKSHRYYVRRYGKQEAQA